MAVPQGTYPLSLFRVSGLFNAIYEQQCAQIDEIILHAHVGDEVVTITPMGANILAPVDGVWRVILKNFPLSEISLLSQVGEA